MFAFLVDAACRSILLSVHRTGWPAGREGTQTMTSMEKSSLKHAADWLRYQRSPQYKADLNLDRQQRAIADAKAGHSASCSLTSCHPSCGRLCAA